MDPIVYQVLKRLAPPPDTYRNYCYVRSPHGSLAIGNGGRCLLVCTLPKAHTGYHVAHVSGNAVDVWE